MRRHGFLASLSLLTVLAVPPLSATQPAPDAAGQEPAALQAEIERLRERVATLEAQCADTSDHEPPPAGGVPGGTPKYLLKARWDRLKTGMEMGEVRTLLGSPSTVTRSATGQVTVWGYGSSLTNRYGVGTVYFDDDDEVGTWISPSFKTD